LSAPGPRDYKCYTMGTSGGERSEHVVDARENHRDNSVEGRLSRKGSVETWTITFCPNKLKQILKEYLEKMPIPHRLTAPTHSDQPTNERRNGCRKAVAAALCLGTLLGLGPGADADQSPINFVETVGVGLTGTDANNNFTATIPGITTWRQNVPIRGGGWTGGAGAVFDVFLRGPLNTLGVAPIQRGPLPNRDAADGVFRLDASGNFQGTIRIPFENGAFVPSTLPNDPDITRPGLYTIRVIRHGGAFTAQDVANSAFFNICPETQGFPGWAFERGARDGWLGDHSPERTDPEWVTVWGKQPVGLYATVAPSTLNGSKLDGLNQGSHFAYQDYPWSHFAHDWNLHLIPDFQYLWTLATSNFHGSASDKETGRIEWEWEFQNNGSPFVGSYGQGSVGVPPFVLPTVGDRIYTVGRWALDNGHPDEGAHSEIHPPRMIATMRKRNTVVPFVSAGGCVTRASQVDIFVSGHGGGINQIVYTELERLLDNNGKGGARLSDIGIGTAFELSGNPLGVAYHRFGPNSIVHGTLQSVLQSLQGLEAFLGVGGAVSVPEINDAAGPSAMFTGLDGSGLPALNGTRWQRDQQEFLPVNDMDYEFDVPLPPRPAGATTPLVQMTKQPMDSTSVNEEITYFPSASPTTAHIRLPYKGADNGIYARTLQFYWNAFSAPGKHFVVQLTGIDTPRAPITVNGVPVNFVGPQPLYLLADVCGQWRFLPDLNPTDLLTVKSGLSQTTDHASFAQLAGAQFDVFLDDADSLRVFVGGYAQRDMDSILGRVFSLNAYDAGIEVALASGAVPLVGGTGDNQELGGAVLDAPIATTFGTLPGPHIVDSARPIVDGKKDPSVNTVSGGACPDPLLRMFFNVTFVPPASQLAATPAPLNFGSVCPPGLAGFQSITALPVTIRNPSLDQIFVNSITVSGNGFSLFSAPTLPLLLNPGAQTTVQVQFSPTAAGTAAGTLTVGAADPCRPSLTVPLTASVQTPTISASANTLSTPTLTLGSVKTWPVTIRNLTPCTLHALPSISGFGGKWETVLPSSYFFLGRLINDITVPPGGVNTDLTVKFTSSIRISKASGTLTVTSNDLLNPKKTLTFGAEGVPAGVRVLVVGADEVPLPTVDEIILTSQSPEVNIHQTALPLVTIDPPESWKRIQYHYTAELPPTQQGAAPYSLSLQVGNKKRILNFPLGAAEFKELTIIDDASVSHPVMLSARIIGENVELTWTSNAGITYRAEYNADPGLAIWTALPGDVWGTGNVLTLLDALSSSNRFYRIRSVPAQ
jgi:hypothetical protein